MAEPNATTIGTAISFGTVTLTGTLLGMHYDALGIGFLAALFSLMHIPPKDGEIRTPWRVFTLVTGAALFAGMFSPLAAAAATNYLPWTASLGVTGLRLAAAATLAITAHIGIPLFFSWMSRLAGSKA